jgi:hypothetical protein
MRFLKGAAKLTESRLWPRLAVSFELWLTTFGDISN